MAVGTSGPRRRRRRWRFGEVVFDEAAWSLSVSGRVVDLEGKPLQVLHELLLNAGEAVSKDELLDAVWPDVHVVEASLTTAVSKLRTAIGDREGRVVQTLPRLGYRLVATVEVEQLSTPLAPRFAFAPGEAVPGRPQWVLEAALGDSGAADVWRARHRKIDETRIFKFADAPDRLRGLRREVALFRLMRSVLGEARPGVDVLEWNFDTAPYFIEAEDAGRDLRAWAEALDGGLGALSLADRLALVAATARALAAAHGAGVLHKDLKPANILIQDRAGERPVVRLADFGSGALVDEASLGLHGISGGLFLAEEGVSSDTPAYRAPEVTAGGRPGMASDIYALGLILYQMIVGDLDRPLAPGWEADIADPLLREDVALAAAGDIDRRLPSAALLADRLDSLETRRSALAAAQAEAAERAETQRREAARAARRPWVRLAAGLAGLGLIASMTGAVIAFQQRDEARRQTAAAEASYAFLVDDLLGQANPLSGTAAQETLAAAALRARATIDPRFAGQPAIAAGLHLSLANAFAQRGQYDEARRSFQMADAAYGRAGLEATPAASRARLLHARAEALSGQPGSLETARGLLDAERRRLGAAAEAGMLGFHVAQVEAVIGFFGDLEASSAAFERALGIARARPTGLSERDVVLARQQQAVVLMRLGRPAEAQPALEQVVADWERLAGPDQASTLIARQNLAQARLMNGDLAGTLAGADRLQALLDRRFGPQSRYALGLKSTLYEAYMALERYDEAAAAAEDVWTGAAESQGPASHQALVGLNDLGLALCRSGQREAGLRRLDQAYRSVLAAFGPDYELTHVIRFFLGDCLLLDARREEARRLLDQVDRAKVGSLLGDADWGAALDLAQAELAQARGDRAAVAALRPGLAVFGAADAPSIERRRYEKLVASTARGGAGATR